MTWSKKRKLLYAGILFAVFLIFVGLPVFLKLYKAPTCFDGIRNGKEQGIDCGGSCQRLCPSSFFAPSVAWTRFEKIAPGVYNLAAYIINPNAEAEASNVPYRMIMYDRAGVPVANKSGVVTLPPHRNTLAFIGGLNLNQSIPVKASFEFLSAPEWVKKSDPLSPVMILDKNYSEDETGSSLQVKIGNSAVFSLDSMAVYAVLYDKDKNAIGFSKTIIDELPAQGTALAPFTWPVNHKGEVISQEILPVAE